MRVGRSVRRAPILVLVVTLFGALAVPAQAEEQIAEDNLTVSKSTLTQAGVTTTDEGSIAVAGPTQGSSQAMVFQKSIQVIAGPKEARDSSTQIATNDASVTQTTAAVSGDATASDGGTAISGSASAESLAIVHQLNIQVIAGHTPSDGVTQVAANSANVDQTSVAVSGDASAAGEGSTATSGDASAQSSSVVHQRNVQVYAGKGPPGSVTGALDQVAVNATDVNQTVAAASGAATASDNSDAMSGDAEATAESIVRQSNRQTPGQRDILPR